MPRSRYFLWSGLLLLLILAGALYFSLDWLLADPESPPNYTLLEPGLYMGGQAKSPPAGTDVVLNLSQKADSYRVETHRWEPIVDGEPAPSLEWLGQQVQFIEEHRANGKTVFIHCDAGVSRSGVVIVALYMKTHRLDVSQATALVQSKRPGVRPKRAFEPLLKEWERQWALPQTRENAPAQKAMAQ